MAQPVARRVDRLRVDDEAREVVVEHLRLDAGARPGAGDVEERGLECTVPPRPGPDGERGSREHGQHDEDGDRQNELVEAQP